MTTPEFQHPVPDPQLVAQEPSEQSDMRRTLARAGEMPVDGIATVNLLTSMMSGSYEMVGQSTACESVDGDLFPPRERTETLADVSRRHTQALELCGWCPARAACREFAETSPEQWAGWVIGGKVYARPSRKREQQAPAVAVDSSRPRGSKATRAVVDRGGAETSQPTLWDEAV